MRILRTTMILAASALLLASAATAAPAEKEAIFTTAPLASGSETVLNCQLANVGDTDLRVTFEVRNPSGGVARLLANWPVRARSTSAVGVTDSSEVNELGYCAFIIHGLSKREAEEVVRANACVRDPFTARETGCIAATDAR